jgi:DNA repair protein RadB
MDPVPTGCGPLDDLLGGGLAPGAVTQLYGPPGAGKTNLALSAALETAARDAVAVLVDTEGLSVDRFEQLAAARAGAMDGADPDAALDDLAGRVIVSDAHDLDEQAEAVRDATEIGDRTGLIVVDSVTGFYRLERDEGDEGETLRRVGRQLTHLLSAARREEFPVLVTNQVFTDPDADVTRPLGGHTLAHWCGAIVRLERFRGGNRRATLEHHRSRAAGDSVRFRITETGFGALDGPAPAD